MTASPPIKRDSRSSPGNPAIAYAYSNVLLYRKRYADAAEVARLGLATDKNDQSLKTNLLKALLQGGQKEEGLKLARQMIGPYDALALNNVAYQLGDSGTETGPRPAVRR